MNVNNTMMEQHEKISSQSSWITVEQQISSPETLNLSSEENNFGSMALDDFLGETFSKRNSPGSENEAKGGKSIVLPMWAQEGLVQRDIEYLGSAISVLHDFHENRNLQKEVDKAEKEAFGEQDLQHLWHRNILKRHHHRLYKCQETMSVYNSGHNSKQKPEEGSIKRPPTTQNFSAWIQICDKEKSEELFIKASRCYKHRIKVHYEDHQIPYELHRQSDSSVFHEVNIKIFFAIIIETLLDSDSCKFRGSRTGCRCGCGGEPEYLQLYFKQINPAIGLNLILH
ncbi:hypothetical protein DUI87_18157 [Hirundo rustica rustica]|uniref:Uncharacterized protein n=1 Tax=Hirundo rustica rustica TaxID=333673 RepID=A0A3M0KCS6_HIRRU|nr:hypothetical protein DUI87_18157 [Hirundo rustica rustica]